MKKLLLLLPAALLLVACSAAKPNFAFLEKTAVDQTLDLPGHETPICPVAS